MDATGKQWVLAAIVFGIGAHSFKAVVENAGDSSVRGPSSADFTITVNGTTPTQIATIDSLGGKAKGLVSDSNAVLSGKLSSYLMPGETLEVYDGNNRLGTAIVNGSSWSYTPASAWSEGAHSLTVKVVGAGGAGAASTPSDFEMEASPNHLTTISATDVVGAASCSRPGVTRCFIIYLLSLAICRSSAFLVAGLLCLRNV